MVKHLICLLIISGLFIPAAGMAIGNHEISLQIESDDYLVNTPITFNFLLDGQSITSDELNDFGVRLYQNNKEIFHSDSFELIDPSFTYRFTISGQYYLGITGEHVDGSQIENNYALLISDLPAEPQSIARGVLVLLVSGGVLLSLTLAFLIIIRRSNPVKNVK